MDNVQTPGGNTTTAGAVEGLARRIADELIPNPENESVVYKSFHRTAERAALAAIIETTEAAARLVEETQPQFTSGLAMLMPRLPDNRDGLPYATALRSNDHLKGPKP